MSSEDTSSAEWSQVNLAGNAESLWMGTTPSTHYPPLEKGVEVDVAILGGGIAGMTVAYFLKQAGFTVAVVEAAQIAARTSGNTTAKVTSLHGMKYAFLQSHFGKEGAGIYAESNQWAIEELERIITTEQISCDFQRTTAYTYATSEEKLEDLHKEAEAAQSAGLPAQFVSSVSSVPFPITGTVQCANQAYFHPRKFLLALAQVIPGNGSFLFEQTRAETIKEGEPCEVVTEKGSLKAKDIIIATNFPVYDQRLFFARMSAIRSYALAARLKTSPPDGMFFSMDEHIRSFRPHLLEKEMWIIVGGEDHPVGKEENTIERYQRLEAWTRSTFAVDSIDYRWSAQNSSPVDRVPYIGKQLAEHLYVTTGYGEWGMTTSLVSATLLTDLIQGSTNAWASLYSPSRIKPIAGAKNLFRAGVQTVEGYLHRILPADNAEVSALQKGEGKVIDFQGAKIGVSRDETGTLHAVSAVCTHLGCLTTWNTAEQSWDCPCHGSRFTKAGKVINGPTVKPLPAKEGEDTQLENQG